MKIKIRILFVLFLFCVLVMYLCPKTTEAVKPSGGDDLDSKFLRNGECYLMFGEKKTDPYKGIYRLNNSVTNQILYPPQLCIKEFNYSEGFYVDIDRTIFTFTVNEDKDFSNKKGNIWRQVLDNGVSEHDSDMGTGRLHHTDARTYGKNTSIYRTVNSGNSRSINVYKDWHHKKSTRQVVDHYDPVYNDGKFDHWKPVYRTETYYKASCSNCDGKPYNDEVYCKVGALNPGTGYANPTPSTYKLPELPGTGKKGKLNLPFYPGKKWYSIPNGAWFSSWNPNGKGYMCYSDREQELVYRYMLMTWKNGYGKDSDSVKYPSYTTSTNPVATKSDERTLREYVCGCLDSCAADGGSGTTKAKSKEIQIVMQPAQNAKVKDGSSIKVIPYPSRVYSLAREKDSPEYELKLAKGDGGANKIDINKSNVRGYPDLKDSTWIGISLKNASEDYVYIMGPETIKKWYSLCWPGKPTSSLKYTAVGVSNQWDQQGGIIYAYEKSKKEIHKFECNDLHVKPEDKQYDENPGVSNLRFLRMDVAEAINSMGGDAKNCDIDDIKADGFGRVFFALTFPSKDSKTYDPVKHFVARNAVHMCVVAEEGGYKKLNVVLKCEFCKVVFEKESISSSVIEVGRKTIARQFYNIQVKVSDKCYSELVAKGNVPVPTSSWLTIISNYASSDSKMDINASNWKDHILFGNGNCSHSGSYTTSSDSDPGKCKMAVINVPTPPRIRKLGDGSLLDIIGPYKTQPSVPDKVNRNTNQKENFLGNNITLDLNKVYFYMVENYPLDDGAQDPTAQPDWDEDGRKGGFITGIRHPAPYNKDTNPNGVHYIWKTWQVLDLYGNSCCKLIQSNESTNGYEYNAIYSPVFGKFIMTCKVQYTWYDYNRLQQGDTIDFLDDIKETCWAKVAGTSGNAISSKDRLNEIKSSFVFNSSKFGKNLFMLHPKDKDWKDISVDYDQIIKDGDGIIALEPISIGTGVESTPDPVYQVAEIQRCDDIPSWRPASNYLEKNEFWKPVPNDTKCFGIVAGEVYNWRINMASQTNMLSEKMEYLINEMTNKPSSPFYVNGNPKYQYQKNGPTGPKADIRWADNKILVSAKLIYKAPNGTGGIREVDLPLKSDVVKESSGSKVGSDYEYEFIVKPGVADTKNMVYFTTAGELPPTDPYDATIQINMRRQYSYDMWVLNESDDPLYSVQNIPGWLQLTGRAKVRIMDVDKPKIVWDQTQPSHGNLFGTTARALKAKDGPSGKQNPDFVKFTLSDNNPWEAESAKSPAGLPLAEHISNYAFNFGKTECDNYCKGIKWLTSVAGSGIGLREEIKKRKTNKQPSSDLNYKPLFSKEARDVRFMFETVKRESSSTDIKTNGKVRLGLVNDDEMYPLTNANYSNVAGSRFNEDDSEYALHYRTDTASIKQLGYDTSKYWQDIGGTRVYNSTMGFKIPIEGIKIGTKKDKYGGCTSNNVVPDGYANNTPGYKPYEFYVSATDSSGNYFRGNRLNLALQVKDDIPPVACGSVYEDKEGKTSYFPNEANKIASESATYYQLSGENYFATDLNENLVRAEQWLPSKTHYNGYINDVALNTYSGVVSLGDDITTAVTDAVFIKQVQLGLSPQYVEDNVETEFKVYVSDNCGGATATMKLKYFATDGRNGTQPVVEKTIESYFISGAKVGSSDHNVVMNYDNVTHTVFRGRTEQFPMAIPISIYSEDDARDWDYYPAGSGSDDGSGSWKWNPSMLVRGKDDHNKRLFKTSLPVFGSTLDIRILDKTMKNKDKK